MSARRDDPAVDDLTVGLVLRALRIRRGWRQRDLAARVGCSQSVVSRIESGHLGGVTVDLLRRLFETLDARLELLPRWRGADLERLVDADHAAVVAATVQRLELAGWEVAVEVTYSVYGERGSIDVLATRSGSLAALVIEVKTELASAERIGRKLDEKARLAPKIVRDRLGWTPRVVGRLLVMPDRSRLRRTLDATPILARMFPDDGLATRRWLAAPVGDFAGRWFLSGIAPRHWRKVAVPAGPSPRAATPGHRARAEPGGAPRPPRQPAPMPRGDS